MTAAAALRSETATSGSPSVLLVITTTDVGGAEGVVRDLAVGLRTEGLRPFVCSLCPPGRTAAEVARAGIEVHTLGMSEGPRLPELVGGAFALGRLIDRLGIDLVHAILYRANVVAGIAGRFARRRPVLVSGQHSLTAPMNALTARVAQRWTRGLAARVVAVSSAVKAKVVDSERLAAERIVVIENGIDTDRYAPRPDGPREPLTPAPGVVTVGTVARLSASKAIHDLVDAVAIAREAGVPLRLVIAGDGPERAGLEAHVRARRIGEHVAFLGLRSDPRPVYAALDVFALSSVSEASPAALLEAMASGLPVVATRVGGVPEMVDHRRCGILVEPGSPPELARALAELAADPVVRQRYGAAGRLRVTERFSVRRMVRAHAQLYRELVR